MAQVERRSTAQVFGPEANTFVILSLIGSAVGFLVLVAAWMWFTRSDYVRDVGERVQQPVPYSHQLHVGGLKLQCQYCHNGVGESAYANVPATETCMSCHSQVGTSAPSLQPVRDSWITGIPIQWNQVHKLPDFVYFNHAIHVNKGVGCSTCHGNVAGMSVVYKVQPMFMAWCINCHRNPEQFVRPADQIYNTTYQPPPPAEQAVLGAQLVKQYGIKKDHLTNCYVCHR